MSTQDEQGINPRHVLIFVRGIFTSEELQSFLTATETTWPIPDASYFFATEPTVRTIGWTSKDVDDSIAEYYAKHFSQLKYVHDIDFYLHLHQAQSVLREHRVVELFFES